MITTSQRFTRPPRRVITTFHNTPAGLAPAQLAEYEELFPGLLDAWDEDGSGMDTTDTVDLGIVLGGSIVLRLDDGVERTLHTGNAFVQSPTPPAPCCEPPRAAERSP